MITPFTLTAALQAMGVAEVFIGDPMTLNGMTSLGSVEGTITVNAPQTMNPLTAPELTGEVAHQSTITFGNVTLTVPVILGDPAIWARISPTGKKSGGNSIPQKVLETSVLVIPRSEVGGGLTYDAVTDNRWERSAGNGVLAADGAGAAPKNAVWLWRAYATFGALPYSYGNGGKVITEVVFTAMFDATKPEDHKIFTIGDPRAVAPTPINVIL